MAAGVELGRFDEKAVGVERSDREEFMRLAEETILMLLNEESGYLEQVQGWNLSCVLAGAVLADLALEDRIDTDLESLTLLDATETGDDLLDPVLAQIAADATTRNAEYWIEKTVLRSDDVLEMVLDRLVDKKILNHHLGGFWSLSGSVSRTGTYPAADGTITAQVKTRVFRTIAEDVIPDPRDVFIIGLVNACDAFRFLLAPEEYEESKERIELLSNMYPVTRAIATAVSESSIRLSSRAAAMTKPVPRVKLLRMIAKKSLRQGNLVQLVAELHEEYGSVFAIKPPFVKRGLTVLAGADANTWMNRKGRFHLRTKDLLSDWEKVYGASRTLPGMDGAEHYRLRRAQHRGYSRAALEERLDELFDTARAGLRQWKVGDILPGASSCKGLMGSQISQLAVGVDTSDYILDLVSYKERSLVTHVQRSLPKFMLKTPGMRRKRKKIFELFEIIQAAHAPGLRKDAARDFVDDMMSLHISDPQFLPETDLLFVFVTPMIASIYLGSALAFAIYAMVTHPDLYERVQAEADALFANGDPGREDISMSAMDVTHRLIMESHRLYPIIPVTMRHVMNTFVMDGYEIPVRTRVILAKTAPHYVDKHFPDPLKFDIDRYLPERGEHRKPGVYAPFGLGTHTCLGSRWVELQMVVNLLLIAHHFTIGLHPTDYKIGYNPFPTSSPNKKLRFEVKAIRHPGGNAETGDPLTP